MQKHLAGAGLVWLAAMVYCPVIKAQDMNIRVEKGKVTELTINGRKIPKDSFTVYEADISKVMAQYEVSREAKVMAEKQAAESMAMLALDQKKLAEAAAQAKMEADKMQVEMNKVQLEMSRKQAEMSKEMAEKSAAMAEEAKKMAEADHESISNMKSELVKDGVVSDEKDIVSVELGSDSFIVNGKKLSEELHKKYAERFLKGKGMRLSYHDDHR